MIKYYGTSVVFQEIPDEISLAINVTNCPHRCTNCHSPQLRDDVGIPLTVDELDRLIVNCKFITCILFMGGDRFHQDVARLCDHVHKKYDKLKCAMYSGDDQLDPILVEALDYYKIGHYDAQAGSLKHKTTNQILYKREKSNLIDITYRFWHE